MFRRKNKFEKIKRSDVVDKIISFEQERGVLEDTIVNQEAEIEDLYKKGYSEKNPQMRMVFANKIKRLRNSNAIGTKRIRFLDYNINILEQLKNAIDDREFIKKRGDDKLTQILGDAKSLMDFLLKSTQSREQAEANLVGAAKTFDEVEDVAEMNEEIYGLKDEEEDILAQFERGAMLNDELGGSGAAGVKKNMKEDL